MLYTLRAQLAPWLRVTAPQPVAEPLPDLKGHIPALDAIRGLAIVLVTLYRFGGGDHGLGRAIDADWLVEPGSRGVDLFFVLSGFLITGILYDAKGKERYFRNFYIRRSLRIFPLYYGVLAATVFLLPILMPSAEAVFRPAIEHQAWLWLYAANFFQAYNAGWCLGPFNHFWSLAVEEHFYLAWPLVIFLCSRRTAMRVCFALIVASMFGRIAWLVMGGNGVAIEVLTPLRMDGLALGGWLALVVRGEGGLAWLVRWAKPAAVASGIAVLALWLADKRLMGIPYTLWSIFFGAMLILIIAAPRYSWLRWFGNSRPMRFFGKYSYAMYVFQNPLIPLMAGIVTAPGLAAAIGNAWIAQAVYCAIMFALTTAIGVASWYVFEKYWLGLKQRLAA